MPLGRTIFITILAGAYVTGLHAFAGLAERQAATVSGLYDVGRLQASGEAGCDGLCR